MSELTDDYFGEPWEPCSGEDPCTKKTGCTYAAGHSVPHSNDSDLNSPPAGTLPLPATKGPPEGNGPQSAGIVAGDELSDPPPAAPPAARDDAQSSPPVGPASPKANVAQPKVAAEHSGHQTDETSSDSAKEPNRHAVKTDVKESEYDAAVRKAHEEGKWAGWDEIEREFNKAFGKALAHEIEKGDGSLHRARVTRSYKSIKKYAKDIGVVIAEGDSAALPTTMNKSDIPKVVDEALRLLKRLPR